MMMDPAPAREFFAQFGLREFTLVVHLPEGQQELATVFAANEDDAIELVHMTRAEALGVEVIEDPETWH